MPDQIEPPRSGLTRNAVLKAAMVALPAPLLAAAAAPASPAAETVPDNRTLSPTPQCDDGDDPTPSQMEGPYFKPNSPQRTALTDGPGVALNLSGHVFGITCAPIPDALLDFWLADDAGAYDNVGYRFRGHQYSGADGSYRLTTIVPGLYPGRTRHIHVKVQAPGEPILTTQLYFPGEPRNNTDPLFDPELLMTMRTVGNGRDADFDFVLDVDAGPGSPGDPGAWSAGTAYAIGDVVTHGGRSWRCLIAHTAVAGWEPSTTPALWRPA
ncbi:carbohydrate-binding protein [Stackebrandtia soli]|uniref:carbohydrate-binding protein n=1 Tax=Stackebrandtia soli TaxID=1892856 RepID=UPI0039ED1D9F